ncbi:MAG: alpha-L-fucosidase [Planctomycetota bacterium]|jgi:alpha-L-fucosidase
MHRRSFLKAAGFVAGAVSMPGSMSAKRRAPDDLVDLPKPTLPQLAWQQAEVGLVYHYDLHVFDGKRYSQRANRKTSITEIDMFNPRSYDTDQWIEAAAAMGARFAIITASHETGFRLWQSDANPYSTKALKWRNGKGDVVGDFIDSCHKYGIKPGVYFGARWNSHLGVLDFKVQPHSKMTQTDYNKLIENEVEEICSRYGELFEIWFDGGILAPDLGGPDVLPIFAKHQPNCLFYHSRQRSDARWGGSESGTVGYPCWATMPFKGSRGHVDRNLLKHGDLDGKYWSPAMADAPLRNHEWFWEPDDEHKIYPLDSLVNMYYKSVGRNATLILGAVPDDRGLIPDADFKRMAEFGGEIRRRFSKPLAQAKGRGKTIELGLKRSARFNHVVIMEDIARGERVREYAVEAFVDGNKWQKICDGISIGHKRIQQFKSLEAAKIRLRITKAAAGPIIRELAVYYTA